MRRKLGIIAGAALMLCIVGVVVTRFYLGTARSAEEGQRRLAGLDSTVTVWRDSLDVPHVWAHTTHDLFFVQGYLHATDRLWQMELMRRVAQGRLAEILGPGLVDTDRFLRTIGLWRAAGAQEDALPIRARDMLQAYVAGVNAYLATRSGALPPEFVALRIQPEPWTVRASLAMEKVMAWDLALYNDGVQLAGAIQKIGPARAAFLLPAYPDWGPDILEAPVPPAVPAPAAALLDAFSVTHASNAWVVGGQRTVSGKPILANDMHLALRAPSLWYLMALHGGGLDVTGMTLPGVPTVIAGHNRAIAWGFTNAMLDDVDLFVERPDPADPSRYLVPGGSEPFRVVAESLKVRGVDTALVFPVRLTRHGPVLENLSVPGPDVLAMRWAALDVSHSMSAFPDLDRATNWQQFLDAVSRFDDPHQNVVYADTAGHFGYVMGGRIPIRGDNRLPPTLPVPGWTGEWDWRGYQPFSSHPRELDPPSGYIVTANNRQAATPEAALISGHWEMPFRALRIGEMIRADSQVDAAAMHRMQLDVHDALADRYLERATAAFRAAQLDEPARDLGDWDRRAAPDSHGAALFYVWYESLRNRVRRELYGGNEGWLPRDAFNTVLDSARLLWLPKGGVARFDSLAAMAARDAVTLVRDQTWGDLHQVVAQHALAAAPALDKILNLNVGPAPGPGSPTTVNASQYSVARFPVRAAYGPSERHVVDMSDVDASGGFIIPTGESGLPFDPHYRDQWDTWLHGGLWLIPLDRQEARRRARHILVLQPESVIQ